jgi:AraC family transcriptional regulator of arabinose operon
MKRAARNDSLLFVPYLRQEEKVSSPRYRWNNWERGRRPYVILQWTLSGAGEVEGPQGVFSIGEGSALVVVVPERSSYYYPAGSREPWVFSWLNFYGDLACDLFRNLQMEFGPVIPLPRRSAAAASLQRLISLAAPSRESDRWQVSLQAYAFVLEWWREVTQPRRHGEDGLEWAIRFCRERFREPLVVKELAGEAGMSREHFSRMFTARMKDTPAAFLRRLRIEESSTLLRETRLPLGEIAMRSGFHSARHLMLTFQRVRGINPSRLRGGS